MLPRSAKIRHSDEDKVQQKSGSYAYQELRRTSLANTTTKDDNDFVGFYESAKKEFVYCLFAA